MPCDFPNVKNIVDAALSKNELIVLIGNCFVKYEGRAASKLSEGDRLVVVKPDGTFLVHQNKGMAAINYQGPGSVTSSDCLPDYFVIKSQRFKPLKEEIEVKFSSIHFANAFKMQDDSKLRLFGSERQLSDLLMEDLDLFEKGLQPVQQESEVKKGTIDILARDERGNLVVIEVKRRSAGLDAVTQLSRYVSDLRHRKSQGVRGILCSPEITPNALNMLEGEGLEYYRLSYEIGNPSAKIKGLEKKQKTLDGY